MSLSGDQQGETSSIRRLPGIGFFEKNCQYYICRPLLIDFHSLLKSTGKLSKTKQTKIYTSLRLLQRSEFDSLSSLNFSRFFFNSLGCSFNCETHVHFLKLQTINNIPDLLRLVVLPRPPLPHPTPPYPTQAPVLSQRQFQASGTSIPLLLGIF